MNTTRVFSLLLAAFLDPKIRIIVLRGGTRSGKTWAILQLLIIIAKKVPVKRLISVVSETMPHLRRGAMRDFENMLEQQNAFNKSNWHGTNSIYTFGKGQIEFFSADSEDKVLGPARWLLYINECINVSFDVYRALAVRTEGKKILDYNPAFDFWVDDKILVRDDVAVIDSTYLDNDALSPDQIAEIESNKDIDPDWWNVYGLGLKGSKEGLVIKNWDIVPAMPPHFKDEYIGVDFGWSAPTAVMHIRRSEGEVYIDELAYGPNLENKDIAEAIINAGLKHVETICDAAEPKSIADLVGHGINAVPSGNKEIALGIQVMNRYKKHYTERSLNSIYENRNYRYAKDKATGKYGSLPVKAHGHAKDAERYVFLNRLSQVNTGIGVTSGRIGARRK